VRIVHLRGALVVALLRSRRAAEWNRNYLDASNGLINGAGVTSLCGGRLNYG
jgi:hypothetical protein